jgi:methylthioribose-1-phosphate isomerase
MSVEPIRWLDNKLQLLDQRKLPREVVWVTCSDAGEVARAIRDMVVRGAPAIGVAAAFGIALAALRGDDVPAAASELRSARPTAVNLAWAVDRMLNVCSGRLQPADLVAEAQRMFAEDVEANHRIGRFGAALLGPSTTILTHCNAGALATAGYGTALGVVRAAAEGGKRIAVFADETRPYLQGARLTAWELQQDGIDVTLITDNMSGHFFQQGLFDAVIVGADRIAANGDAANKIGTYTLAVLANAHGVPFYVAAPISTVDMATPNGAGIPIEERSASEVTSTCRSR